MLLKVLAWRGVLYFLGLLYCLFFSTTSFAARAEEFGSGLDQSFSAGYSQKSFAQSFHTSAFEEPADEAAGATWGTWRLLKGFNFSTVYDSNIFLTPKNEKDDEILIYTPTIGVIGKGRHDFLKTFYDLSYTEYIKNGKLSRFNHSWTTEIGYRFPKLKIDFYNNFKPDTAYAVGERTELRSAEPSKVITYADEASGKIDYELTPKTHLSYTQRTIFYYFPSASNASATKRYSSQTHIFNPRMSYQIAPKTDIYADYEFDTADFFKGGDYSSKSSALSNGIIRRISPNTKASLEFGYRWRDYDDTDAAKDQGIYQFKAALSQLLTYKTSVTFWAARGLQEDLANITSTRSANRIVYYTGTNLMWQINRVFDFQGSGSVGYDTKDGTITQTDSDNSTVIFTRPLNNNFYEGSASLNWSPRPFVSATVGYKYFRKESSFGPFDYEDHKVVTALRLKF